MAITITKLLTKERLVLISMFFVLLAVLRLIDPDYFWHLKTGEYIFTHREIPVIDIFSFTRSGQPSVPHEWLFETILYGMFAWMGPLGVKLLTASLAMCALCVSFATLKRMAATPAVALVLLLAVFTEIMPGISPRPHLVTYVFFAAYLYVLLDFKYFHNTRVLPLLPLLMVPWVNAHGGFLLGIALVGLFTGSEWIGYWIRGRSDEEMKRRLVRLTLAAVVTGLASLVNQEFIGIWLYPFQVVGLEVTRQIMEWLSPNFQDWETRLYLILVFTTFVSYTYAERKPDLTELLVPGFLMVAGFISIRHIPLAVLTMTPFIAIALSRGSRESLSAISQRTGLTQFYKKWIGGGKQLGHGEYLLNWIVLLMVVVGLVIYYPIYHAGDKESINEGQPVKAADFVAANDITGNMFNNYDNGGYLIYRLWPARKVFVDPRADFYGDKFLKQFFDIYHGHATWKEEFDKFAIDYVICGKDAPIRQLLLAEKSFKEVYEDKSFSVLLRDDPKHQAIFAKLGK